ncbi:hypothetical protein B0H19DRAFT_1243546 [Mycena capillaripes]|nr:hypothetical protein B0H19DRAFT_1243546 [Mycena capillaripes]
MQVQPSPRSSPSPPPPLKTPKPPASGPAQAEYADGLGVRVRRRREPGGTEGEASRDNGVEGPPTPRLRKADASAPARCERILRDHLPRPLRHIATDEGPERENISGNGTSTHRPQGQPNKPGPGPHEPRIFVVVPGYAMAWRIERERESVKETAGKAIQTLPAHAHGVARAGDAQMEECSKMKAEDNDVILVQQGDAPFMKGAREKEAKVNDGARRVMKGLTENGEDHRKTKRKERIETHLPGKPTCSTPSHAPSQASSSSKRCLTQSVEERRATCSARCRPESADETPAQMVLDNHGGVGTRWTADTLVQKSGLVAVDALDGGGGTRWKAEMRGEDVS